LEDLLQKTRRINNLILGGAGKPVNFSEMARVLSEALQANIYVVSKKGKLLGYNLLDQFECEIMVEEVLEKKHFPEDFNNKVLSINETRANIEQENGKCVFEFKGDCLFSTKVTTIVPVKGGGVRLGTLIMARFKNKFGPGDLILAEYAAAVVGMEILRSRSEKMEEKARKKAAVHMALESLSFSEIEAVEHIFAELNEHEGLIVASKIADRAGITRSVIVNALRKFESAGVIESRSLGMKGTYIKILNEFLMEEIEKIDL